MITTILRPSLLLIAAPYLGRLPRQISLLKAMAELPGQLAVDRSVRVTAHTNKMDWAPSPSPSVWRKRVALEGPQESGRVTSIVRYDANSEFNEHGHPDGEEILVLEGSWQDANGDHPAGTYMLNPEGFHHAPSSKDGCVLWVKLRQHGGPSRNHIRLDTKSMPWQDTNTQGVKVKSLYSHPEHGESMRIEKWEAGTSADRECPAMVEFLFIEGDAHDGIEAFERQSWLRIPAGGKVSLTSATGCEVFIKEGEWRSSADHP